MAGLNKQEEQEVGASSSEQFSELVDELDGVDDSSVEQEQGAQTKKVLFAKSADVRRRIEELLAVRLLRDELSLNHLDID